LVCELKIAVLAKFQSEGKKLHTKVSQTIGIVHPGRIRYFTERVCLLPDPSRGLAL
jgi:hypothetical protein